jgi:hypothetical protein
MEEQDKDLMAEVESIINNASTGIKGERRKEMLGALEAIAMRSESEFTYDKEPYGLILIQQVGLGDVDAEDAHRPKEAQGMSREQLEQAGYGASRVTSPFTTETLDGLREILDSPANQMLTDIMMGKKDWASVTRHKQNGATMYLMVAGGCVSSWTKTPSGEIITSHTDLREEPIDALLKTVCGECKELLRSQWGFTSTIQLLRNNYPNSYAELAREMERKLEENGDEK